MNTKNPQVEMAILHNAALEDLMATSDAQLHQEAIEDGEDLNQLAIQVKTTMREAAAMAQRQRLARVKARMSSSIGARAISSIRPPMEALKQIVQKVFQTDPSLGLAFREGKKQTDADWQSLYDDLMSMGVIRPEDYEY